MFYWEAYCPGFFKAREAQWDFAQATAEVKAQAIAFIEIVPQDKKKIEESIEVLGNRILGEHEEKSGSAWPRLSYIRDERTLPYFAKIFDEGDYSQKFSALQALAKFNNKKAFEVFKKGLETQAQGIRDKASTTELASQLVENIRHATAVALSESAYLDASFFTLKKGCFFQSGPDDHPSCLEKNENPTDCSTAAGL